ALAGRALPTPWYAAASGLSSRCTTLPTTCPPALRTSSANSSSRSSTPINSTRSPVGFPGPEAMASPLLFLGSARLPAVAGHRRAGPLYRETALSHQGTRAVLLRDKHAFLYSTIQAGGPSPIGAGRLGFCDPRFVPAYRGSRLTPGAS